MCVQPPCRRAHHGQLAWLAGGGTGAALWGTRGPAAQLQGESAWDSALSPLAAQECLVLGAWKCPRSAWKETEERGGTRSTGARRQNVAAPGTLGAGTVVLRPNRQWREGRATWCFAGEEGTAAPGPERRQHGHWLSLGFRNMGKALSGYGPMQQLLEAYCRDCQSRV